MAMGMARIVCFVFIVFSQQISGLIPSMTKPGGDPDYTRIISHITLMESSISKLESQTQISHDQITVVNARLQSTSDELTRVRSELKSTHARLRSAEADIITLQDDNKLKPTVVELAAMKSAIADLKSSKVHQQTINLATIDVIGRDLKRNTDAIQSLRSTVESNSVEINNTRLDGELNGLHQRKLQDEMTHLSKEITNASNVTNSMMTDIQTLAARLTNVESNTTHQAVATLQSLAMSTRVEVHKALADIQSLQVHVQANFSTVRGDFSAQLADLQRNTKANLATVKGDLSVQLANLQRDTKANLATVKGDLSVQLANLQRNTKANLATVKGDVSVQLANLQRNTKANLATVKGNFSAQLGNLQSNLQQQIGIEVAFQATLYGNSSGRTTHHFDRMDYNIGGAYNSESRNFTAPVTGTYVFWCILSIYRSSQRVHIYKGFIKLTEDVTYTAGRDITVVTHMVKGEQVTFTVSRARLTRTGNDYHYGGSLLRANK